MTHNIRNASASDVAAMAKLIEAKRAMLESFEPVMWRPSATASQMTSAFFTHVLAQPQAIARVADANGAMAGFIIGVLQEAPPVYAPGGKSVVIDDFAVGDSDVAETIGPALLDAAMSEARARGAVQMIVIAAERDARVARWLSEKKLHVASQWWTRTLSH